MADSIRQQIMDAVITLLQSIKKSGGYSSEVKYVSESYQGYEAVAKSKLPACFPIDTEERKSYEAIGEIGGNNMRGELTVVVTSVVFHPQDKTRALRTNLLRDVEKAIVNGATLIGLTHEIEAQAVTTDGGQIPNFSIFDQEFLITYFYDSANGG